MTRHKRPRITINPEFIKLYSEGIQESSLCECKLCQAICILGESAADLGRIAVDLMGSLKLLKGGSDDGEAS